LTLSGGRPTRNAAFQAIEERTNPVQFMGGPTEIGFRGAGGMREGRMAVRS